MAFRKLSTAVPNAPEPEIPAKVGRPTTYQPEYVETVLALGSEGYSKAELIKAVSAGCRRTFERWIEAQPEFADAVIRARDLSLAWWERRARRNVDSRDFNANLYRIVVGARFPDHGYKDLGIVQNAPAALPVDLSALSPAERDALQALLLKAKAAKQAEGGEDRPRAGSSDGNGSESQGTRRVN